MSVSAITASMRTAVTAISPLILSNHAFHIHRGWEPIGDFCEANPSAAFRLFSIEGSGDVEVETSTTDKEWAWTTIVCAVAYAKDGRSGENQPHDLYDLIESDGRQLEATIGVAGYATLELAAAGTIQSSPWTREEAEACFYGVMTMRVGYWRAVS